MPIRPLKLNETPIYPTDAEAKDYARQYRNEGEPPQGWTKGYKYFDHSDTILCLASWGLNNIFFVVAYPPEGFTIKDTVDIESLSLFEGWILEYQESGDLFNLLYKASVVGYDYWKQRRAYYKSFV